VRIQELLAQPKLAGKPTALARTGLAKSTNIAGIQIDTASMRSIETGNYVPYTFKIVQDSIEKQTVPKNYMLTIVNDSLEIQHLVAYNVLSPGVYDMENIQLERVYGDELRVQFNKCSNLDEGSSSHEVCTMRTCNGMIDGAAVNHGVGDECNASQKAGLFCVTVWLPISISPGPCSSGGGNPPDGGCNPPVDPDLGNAGGGGGGGGAPVNPPSDIPEDDKVFVGIVPNDGLIPPEIIQDPKCNEVAIFVSHPQVKPKLDELRGNLNMRSETGYLFESGLGSDYTSTYLDNTTNNGTSLNLPVTTDDTEGAAHVHMNNYDTPVIHPVTGLPAILETKPIKIQSPQDTSWLLSAAVASIDVNRAEHINELKIQKKFNIVVNNRGMYMIKYEGNIQSLPSNFDGRDLDLVEKFKLAIDEDLEAGYLRFLKDELAIYNIGLYQIKRNGDIYRITLDENNTKVKEKCHDE